MKYNTSVYDEVGNSAVDGIGNLIDEIILSPNEKAVKKMEPAKKYWESIRSLFQIQITLAMGIAEVDCI